MTGRATFGEFAAAASTHLARAVSLTDLVATGQAPAVRMMHAAEIRRGMARIVPVLSRYISDITASYLHVSRCQMGVLAPWSRAAIEAREALAEAAALLAPDREQAIALRPSLRLSASPVGRELDSAIRFMTAGRDLLHTHLSAGPYGTRGYRSEWGPVIVSIPVAGALLVEVTQWARMIASRGQEAALPTVRRRSGDSRAQETYLAQRRLTHADLDSERGRGLQVVAALASDSGVTKNACGKTAWFTLKATQELTRDDLEADHEAEAGA